ncbi:MAG TPA: DUF983 domain-containing protein [Phenylobacterium sp.]|nr:DUF983 domain-containing protein [Phenylobacterium sp.]
MSKSGIVPAIFRGLKGKCPDCGEGRLFWRYLKVQPNCEACDHDLAQYPADDGPAYVTILVIGHLVVAPLLLFPFIWEAPVALVLPITLIPLAFITLGLLPLIKGGFIGLLWALKVRNRDAALHTAEALD